MSKDLPYDGLNLSHDALRSRARHLHVASPSASTTTRQQDWTLVMEEKQTVGAFTFV